MPTVIANEIVGVQPMTGPVGQLHTLRVRYADANSTAGTVVADDAAAADQFRRITDAYNRLVGGEAADTDRAAAQRESEGPAMRARWNIRRRPSAPAF